MKKLKLFALALIGACGTFLFAQTSSEIVKTRFNHPVMAGSVQIPAGEVTFSLLNNSTGSPALLVRAETGDQAVLLVNTLNNQTLDRSRSTEAVLSLKDGVYHLDKLWLASKGVGYQIIGSNE